MKKALIIALAGIMMLAFTQCGGNDSNKDEDKNGKVNNDVQDATGSDKTADFNELARGVEGLVGTEEFNDNVKILKGLIEALDESDNCEDLNNNLLEVLLMSIDYMDKEYASDQLMTEDEQKQLEEISEKYTKAFEKKQEELGCEENLEENNDLGLDSLLLDDDFDLDFDLGGEAITGTKEYKDSVEALAQMTAILDKIKTCEDYNNSMAQWEAISNEMDKRIPLYTEEERMTKEEQNDVRERALEFFNRSDQISRALCK